MSAGKVEALVAAAGAVICLFAYLFSTPHIALSTLFGAIFATANFSVSRYSLKKVLEHGQAAFALLYVTKFFGLVAVLLICVQRLKLDVWGLVLGFTTLPAAMYALLAIALWKRFKG